MADDKTSKKQLLENLLAQAANFQAVSSDAREAAAAKYLAKEKDNVCNLRIIIDGLIAKLALTVNSKIENLTEKNSYQLYLAASFIRSHYLINELIINGDLVEAQTLIRKQMESLARMQELNVRPMQELLERTPNIKYFSTSPGGTIYSLLSRIAHFSTPSIGSLLNTKDVEGQISIHLSPQYNEFSAECFKIHVYICLNFLSWFIKAMKEFYPLYNDEGDDFILQSAFLLAYETEIIKRA